MDAARLAELVDAHAASLELYAARWTNAPEDCVQEAFIQLTREAAKPGYVEPYCIEAWLFRVVRNRALNAARGESRRKARETVVARLRNQAECSAAENQLDASMVTEALDRLPAEASEIIILRIWSGLTFEQIAKILGCSVAAAYRRYQNSLEKLRQTLEVEPCPKTKSYRKR